MKTKSRQRRSNPQLSRRRGWVLWGYWVLATAIAEVVGLGVIAAINTTHDQFDPMHLNLAVILIGTLEGLCLGFFQWLVLRRYLRRSLWWIVATMIGASLAWLLIISASVVVAILNASAVHQMTFATCIRGVALFGVGVGVIVGFAQWFVLKAHLRWAFWWIIANALAWALGLVAAFMGTGLVHADEFGVHTVLFGVAMGSAIGAIIGTITGIALVWLLAERSP